MNAISQQLAELLDRLPRQQPEAASASACSPSSASFPEASPFSPQGLNAAPWPRRPEGSFVPVEQPPLAGIVAPAWADAAVDFVTGRSAGQEEGEGCGYGGEEGVWDGNAPLWARGPRRQDRRWRCQRQRANVLRLCPQRRLRWQLCRSRARRIRRREPKR
jgi:hypothetical protein